MNEKSTPRIKTEISNFIITTIINNSNYCLSSNKLIQIIGRFEDIFDRIHLKSCKSGLTCS